MWQSKKFWQSRVFSRVETAKNWQSRAALKTQDCQILSTAIQGNKSTDFISIVIYNDLCYGGRFVAFWLKKMAPHAVPIISILLFFNNKTFNSIFVN